MLSSVLSALRFEIIHYNTWQKYKLMVGIKGHLKKDSDE
jgi:hypothetical protein